MPQYKLGDVLGGILAAVTEAQYLSDLYTDSLYPVYSGDNELDSLAIPNTEFTRVQLNMAFAIADVQMPKPGSDGNTSGKPPPPQVSVFVDTADLKELPERVISHLDIELMVRNVEALPQDDLVDVVNGVNAEERDDDAQRR